MRKLYSIFIAMLMLPMLAMAADNMAISKTLRTDAATLTDSRAYVDPSILKEMPAVKGPISPSYTIGAWINISDYLNQPVTSAKETPANRMVIFGYGGREHCNDNGCWNLCINKDGNFDISGWGGCGAGGLDESGTVVSKNEWHHVAISYDSEAPSMTLYYDGTPIFTRTMTEKHEWMTDETPAIYFAGYGFAGLMDEAQIWNRALSQDDIAKAMLSANSVDGLVGLYTFDENNGTAGNFNNQSTQACAADKVMLFEKVTASSATNAWGNGLVYILSKGTASVEDPTFAEGRLASYNVTLTIPAEVEGGTLTVTVNGETVEAGAITILNTDEVIVTATPAEGWDLVSLKAGEKTIVSGQAFNLDADAEITALFSNITYSLTITNECNIPYTLTTASGEEVNLEAVAPGTPLRLTLSVPMEYTLMGLKLNMADLTSSTDTYEFEMPSANTELMIVARAKEQFAVNFEQPEGGSLTVTLDGNTINSGDLVYPGQLLTITATPDAAHLFGGILVNGATLEGSTFTMPEEALTIVANFSLKPEWNKSITFINNTSTTATTEDIVEIDHSILSGVTTQANLSSRSITMGGWFRMTTFSSKGNVLFNYGGLNHCNGNGLMTLFTDAQGNLSLGGFGIRERLFSAEQALGVKVTLNEWHYYATAVDFDASEIRFYMDGQLAKTLPFKSSTAVFGSFDDSPWGFGFGQQTCNGSMDDIHIIDRAINDVDAMNLYTDKADAVEGLIGWYTFDEVKAGTTSHFANMVSAKADYDAVYSRLSGSAPGWAGGMIDATHTDGNPDLSTITVELQRNRIVAELETPRTVSVESTNNDLGSVAIIDPATDESSIETTAKRVTIEATPAEGAAFINWTDAEGNIVSTDATYTYAGETDAQFKANFGHSLSFTVGAEGSATVTVNGTPVSSGTVHQAGAQVEITINAPAGKEFLISVNGANVQLEGNTFTTTLDANLDVTITFVDRINHYYQIVNGNGTVECWSSYDENDSDIPAGIKYENGDPLPEILDENGEMNVLNFWFRPGEGASIQSVIWTIGDDTHELFYDENMENMFGYYDPMSDELINAGVKIWWTQEELNNDCTMTVTFTDEAQAIEEIGLDAANGPVEYYNLQGVRVAADNLTSGFYIVRQGEKAVKVFINK